MVNKFAQSLTLIRHVRQQTDTAVLFYSSGGKDSIALLDMVSPLFNKVILVYMYLIKDLDHINIYLDWAKKKFRNVEVMQVPHFVLSTINTFGFFCEPDEAEKEKKESDIIKGIVEKTGVPFVIHGMKGVDGYMKRMRLKKFAKDNNGMFISPINVVYPLALWTNKEVLRYIQAKNLIKPMTYGYQSICYGLSFDYEVLIYLKNNFNADYKKMMEAFPYFEHVMYDYQSKQNKAV